MFTNVRLIHDILLYAWTPKHESWLNMAEIELNVLTNQCLKRRIDDIKVASKEVLAWQKYRIKKM